LRVYYLFMKKNLLCLWVCLFCSVAYAQNTGQTITIKGIVTDSVTNQPLSYVTVALQDDSSKLSVKSTLCKEDGTFTLTAPSTKHYHLVLAFVGYRTKSVAVSSISIVNLNKILLSPSNKQLDAVSISAQRPVMKQEVDRLTYDVQADPESKVITALDMIRKVPLLSVDGNDNIKLRGSGDYKILINGKESAMMAKNPSDILKSMPASNIVKIEVITTPPAKYDAEGLAGIINIITVKDATQGYNGSVNSGYNTAFGYRANLNLTVKEGKIGYTGYAGSGSRPELTTGFENKTSFINPVPSSLVQEGSQFTGNKNVYNSNELSYEIDSLNLLTASFNVFNGSSTQGNSQFTTQRDVNDLITQSYHLQSNGSGTFNGSDLGLNYQLSFKHHKDELLTLSYKYSHSDNKQTTDVNADAINNYFTPNYRQYNNSGSKEYTSQIDYILPMKTFTVEAGGKLISRNNYSNFRTDTVNSQGNYITNGGQENDFTYRQDVYSLYNSYQLKFTKWTFKGGLRLERTTVNANFSATGSAVDQGYNNLVPSFSAQLNLTKTSTLNFGFSQRIQRPGILQLNPFVDSTNNKYISQGNPNLKPAVNNNFELSYGNFAKGSINISTHYSFSDNTIQSITTVDGKDVTKTTYANVGQNKTLGIDFNANYPFTPKLNANINAELLQVWLKGTYNGSFYTNSGQQGHVFTNASYKFDKGLRIGTNIGFDSRYVLLEGRDNWYFGYGTNASQDVLKGKGSISLGVNCPFSKYNTLDFFTKTPDFQTYNRNQNTYRSVFLGFNYKFGKLNSTIKQNQRGINNDDTSNGGRN
jgi:outer membrane receptor protein involved in Fe transport